MGSSVTVIDMREGIANPGLAVIVTGDRITAVDKNDCVEIERGGDGLTVRISDDGEAKRYWPRAAWRYTK